MRVREEVYAQVSQKLAVEMGSLVNVFIIAREIARREND